MSYDIAIIGAGVVGSLIARKLSKYDIKIALVEKCNDVAMGTSKANSAIVHAGFDAVPGTLKADLNVKGTKLMGYLCDELGVPFKNIGSLVIAFNDEEMQTLQELYERGLENNVPGLKIIGQDRLHELEPNVSKRAQGALWAKTASIVCPYELTLAAAEVAVLNGVDLYRNFAVNDIQFENEQFTVKAESGEQIEAKYVINAAGIYSDYIASLIGDNSIEIIARKGEYLLMDKSLGGVVNHVIFQCPTKMGKGVLVTPTVDGNILTGPSAKDIEGKEDKSTTTDELDMVRQYTGYSIPGVKLNAVITSFAGLRAHSTKGDFIIEPSKANPHFINVAGIESPGLSAAPAIAEYVEEIMLDVCGRLPKKVKWHRTRPEPIRFRELSTVERRELIEKDPTFGQIVCRCETVTEGEIIAACHGPIPAEDMDGVKRRTRAGMGRCQSGFCGPKVAEIIARERNKDMLEVTKFGEHSNIVVGKTK